MAEFHTFSLCASEYALDLVHERRTNSRLGVHDEATPRSVCISRSYEVINAQDSLPGALLDVILALAQTPQRRLVHHIRADVVFPQGCRNLKALSKVARLVGHDVNVA